MKDATTLYVGNLSFYTTEEQIHELFSKYVAPLHCPIAATVLTTQRCGEIKRIMMGLDRFQKTPCGFCFVEYYTHQDALDCMKYIGGTKLDEGHTITCTVARSNCPAHAYTEKVRELRVWGRRRDWCSRFPKSCGWT